MTVTDSTGRPDACVTEDMIEEECLVCEAPTQVLSPSVRAPSRRGIARLAGNFPVVFNEFAGEIPARRQEIA
jgi:hypothetical protein